MVRRATIAFSAAVVCLGLGRRGASGTARPVTNRTAGPAMVGLADLFPRVEASTPARIRRTGRRNGHELLRPHELPALYIVRAPSPTLLIAIDINHGQVASRGQVTAPTRGASPAPASVIIEYDKRFIKASIATSRAAAQRWHEILRVAKDTSTRPPRHRHVQARSILGAIVCQ